MTDPPGERLPEAPVTGLAEPQSRLDHVLQYVPRALSSKVHVLLLLVLGIYLVVLPLVGVAVSSKAELIGGNYTNVTSDVGACIAAGGTLHLIRQSGKRNRAEQERLALTRDMHRLLHHVHPAAAAELGQLPAPPL
ncbi:MAG: hypothetical protein ACYC1D_03535 [Acidimicrobiales bacterium]